MSHMKEQECSRVIKSQLSRETQEARNEDHMAEGNDYRKTNFGKQRKYFKEASWNRFNGAKGVEEKWNTNCKFITKELEDMYQKIVGELGKRRNASIKGVVR